MTVWPEINLKHTHRVARRRSRAHTRRPYHSLGVVTWAFGLVAFVTACTPGRSPDPPVPSPSLGQFLHPNYRTVAVSSAHLTKADGAPDVIVTSVGPGLTPGEPTEGGTGDVQVLSYDMDAARWIVAFDAADKVVGQNTLRPDSLGSVNDEGDGEASALLPQGDPLTMVQARAVQLAAGPSDLLVYGLNSVRNHSIGVVGIVDLHTGNGSPVVPYFDQELGMGPPQVVQHGNGEAIRLAASWFTEEDPACCPVRDYTRLLGRDTSGIKVLSDDRPWIGLWVAKPHKSGFPAVVAVVPGSPASALFQPGDRITAVDGATTSRADDDLGLAVLDQIATHHAGDRVRITADRVGRQMTFEITLKSAADPGATESGPPTQFILGVSGTDAPAGYPPGIIVTTAQGPAAAAGLSAGDEITAIGPIKVRDMTDLAIGVLATQGQRVAIAYITEAGKATITTAKPEPAGPDARPILAPAGI